MTEFSEEQLEAIELVFKEVGLPSFHGWQKGHWCLIDDEVSWYRLDLDARSNPPCWPLTWITTPEQRKMKSLAVKASAEWSLAHDEDRPESLVVVK